MIPKKVLTIKCAKRDPLLKVNTRYSAKSKQRREAELLYSVVDSESATL